MNRITFAALAIGCAVPTWGKTLVVPSPAPASPPIEETSTNIVIAVDAAKLDTVGMTISFSSCASNEVMLAIGQDVDADGDLSFDEAAIIWGCDCGEWYCADLRSGVAAAGPEGTLTIRSRDFDPGWNIVKAIKRGYGDIAETMCIDERRKRFSMMFR